MIRVAFWIALLLGILCALAILAQPVIGLAQAAILLAVAWGIKRGQYGAAAAGACVTGLPTIIFLFRHFVEHSADAPSPAVAGVAMALSLVVAAVFAVAAIHLHRRGNADGYRRVWLSVVAVSALWFLTMHPYVMPTGSMENTLLVGDQIMVETARTTLGRGPHLGEMVVFQYPIDHKQTFTKRVVGMPGDRLRLVHKQLYRNGAAAAEPYAVHKLGYEDLYRDNFPAEPNTPLYPAAEQMLAKNVVNGEVVVPEGKYFVMGDNRDQSLDSRYWGFVSKNELIGYPAFIYGSADVKEGQTSSLMNTRWNRLFRVL